MLLIFARIVTTGSWIAVLGFLLIYHNSVKKYLPNIQLPIKQSSIGNAVRIIFYPLFYSVLWINETSLENTLDPKWVLSSVFIGFILVITGVCLMILAIKALYDKRLVSVSQLDFSIFETNPFTIIRHPFYSAEIIIWLGSAMMFINPSGFILGILMFIPMLKMQAKRDEASLFAAYGDSYLMHKTKVGKFFPKIW